MDQIIDVLKGSTYLFCNECKIFRSLGYVSFGYIEIILILKQNPIKNKKIKIIRYKFLNFLGLKTVPNSRMLFLFILSDKIWD